MFKLQRDRQRKVWTAVEVHDLSLSHNRHLQQLADVYCKVSLSQLIAKADGTVEEAGRKNKL